MQIDKSKNTKSGFIIKLSSETALKLANTSDATISKGDESTSAESEHLIETDKSLANVITKNVENPAIDEKSDPALDKDVAEAVCELKPLEQLTVPKNITATDDNQSWGEYAPYITYEGEEAIYTDPNTNTKYSWSKKTKSWELKSTAEQAEGTGRVYSYENDTHVYTDTDGSKCFWDAEKKAWFPKVDDDFLAHYQMAYGFVDNTSKDEKDTTENDKELQKKQAEQLPAGTKRKQEAQWFDASDESTTKVYVSNLPLDMTEEEFVDFMQKCGLVMRDPSTQKMKVKMYMDKEHNCFKGDALCTYIKTESVDLAMKLLDGSDFKGQKIKIEKASFQLKGEYNPALKPKKKKKKELEKLKKMQEKLFDWRPEKMLGERSKHERVVIIKNLFEPTIFDKEVQLLLDYQQDLREECTKCGEVRKVVIYDRHPEGVAQVTMKEPEQADAVVQLTNGRWFGKRKLTAEIWDGRTKYRIAETDADISKRVDKWQKFLDQDEGATKKESKSTVAGTSDEGISSEAVASTEVKNEDETKPILEPTSKV